MVKVLELFSGTGSVGKVCKKLGWEVVSVDMLLPADHQVDIMVFDYKQYDKDEFTYIWGSPPCTAYSKLQDSWLGRNKKDGLFTKEKLNNMMIESDKIVIRTLEIINYFNCKWWFMENPKTGKLKDREMVKDLIFYDVDYCKYSDWGYRKRTRIWTNREDFVGKLCKKDCDNMIQVSETSNLHKNNLGNSQSKKVRDYVYKGNHQHKGQVVSGKQAGGSTNKLDRYRIPEKLIFDLFNEKLIS
tara:strand:+ start:453 stop:1181 length:729 start_codon:yes stop_codon:yes gene_type:complete